MANKSEQLQAIELFKLKRTHSFVSSIETSDPTLLSLVIPAQSPVAEVISYISEVKAPVQMSRFKIETMSVKHLPNASKWFKQLETELNFFVANPPTTGIFCYISLSADHLVHIFFEPYNPIPISDIIFRCDTQFSIKPLSDLIKSSSASGEETIGLLLVDSHSILVATYSAGQTEVLERLPVPRAQARLSAAQVISSLVQKAGQFASQCLLSSERSNVSKVILAGSSDVFPRLDKSILDEEIQAKYVKSVEIWAVSEEEIPGIIKKCDDVLGSKKSGSGKSPVEIYLESDESQRVSGATALLAGEQKTLKALFLKDTLSTYRYSLRSRSGDEIVEYAEKDKEFVGLKIIEAVPILDWAIDALFENVAEFYLISDNDPALSKLKSSDGIYGILNKSHSSSSSSSSSSRTRTKEESVSSSSGSSNTRCEECYKLLDKKSIVVGDKKFHPECFKCAKCKSVISRGSSYVREGSSFICETCSLDKCDYCKRAIEGEFVTFADKKLHIRCFRCDECRTRLDISNFFEWKGKALCKDDYQTAKAKGR